MGRKRTASRRSWPQNLYQNTAGYFYYRHPHTKKVKGLGRDKATAFTEARAANAVLATLSAPKLSSWATGAEALSLAEWTPKYKELWIERTAPAASTIAAHSRHLNRIAAASFAWMALHDITTAHVSPFLEEVEKTSGAGAATNIRSKLSDVFRMAETKGLIEPGKNPVSATYTPNYEVARERLSIEQFLAIRAQAPGWLVNAMNLALLTAQRREDVAALKFSDERDGKLFVVQGKGQGRIKLQIATTIRLNAIDMSIGDAVKACRDQVVSAYMVHHSAPRGRAKVGAAAGLNGMTTAFQIAREAAGIKAEDGRTPPSFHEIRSLSERLYRDQYDAEFAQAILGHRQAKMTNVYDDLRGSGWQVVSDK